MNMGSSSSFGKCKEGSTMPLGRYPERVKKFRQWATKQVDDAKLSGSVTPGGHKKPSRSRRPKRRKRSRKAQLES